MRAVKLARSVWDTVTSAASRSFMPMPNMVRKTGDRAQRLFLLTCSMRSSSSPTRKVTGPCGREALPRVFLMSAEKVEGGTTSGAKEGGGGGAAGAGLVEFAGAGEEAAAEAFDAGDGEAGAGSEEEGESFGGGE